MWEARKNFTAHYSTLPRCSGDRLNRFSFIEETSRWSFVKHASPYHHPSLPSLPRLSFIHGCTCRTVLRQQYTISRERVRPPCATNSSTHRTPEKKEMRQPTRLWTSRLSIGGWPSSHSGGRRSLVERLIQNLSTPLIGCDYGVIGWEGGRGYIRGR